MSDKTEFNLDAQHYLIGVVRGVRQIVRSGLYDHHQPTQSTTSYVSTTHANGGSVVDEEVVSKQAPGRQRDIGSTNSRKGNQALFPQSGGT